MAHGRYKDLTTRTELDTVLRDKAFKTVINPKYNEYETGISFNGLQVFW